MVNKNYISIASLNCWGLRSIKRRKILFNWIRDHKYNIAFLQDTHCSSSNEKHFCNDWEGETYMSLTNNNYNKGVAILFDTNIDYQILNYHTDNEGRCVLVNVEIGEKLYCLVCAYVPTKRGERITFLNQLIEMILRYKREKSLLILAGDLNICRKTQDRNTLTHLQDSSRKVLETLMHRLQLLDAWEIEKNYQHLFTWSDHYGIVKSRLDYFLIDNTLKADIIAYSTKVVITETLGKRITDHKLIEIKILLTQERRGPGYWKLNNKLLEDAQYCREIEKLLENLDKEKTQIYNDNIYWEKIKRSIKAFSINYSKRLAKEKRIKIKGTEQEI